MQSYAINWSEVAKVLLAAITTVIALHNWQGGRRRTKLKDDLDILKRYREEMEADPGALAADPRYRCLRAKVKHRMRKAYVLRGTDQSDLVTGLGFSALAALILFFPKLLPFGLEITPGWRVMLVAIAGGAALLFFWEAIKRRDEERDIPDTNSNTPVT